MPVCLAAGQGHFETVDLLLKSGASFETSLSIRNPLFAAIVPGHIEIARLLIKRGIDTKVKYFSDTMDGMDAWTFAMEQDQPEIAAMLDSEGRTYQPGDGRPKRRPEDAWRLQVADACLDPDLKRLQPILPTPDAVELLFGDFRAGLIVATNGLAEHFLKDGEEVFRHELVLYLEDGWPHDDPLAEGPDRWPFRWILGVARELILSGRSPALHEYLDCTAWARPESGYSGVLFLSGNGLVEPVEDEERGPISPLWLLPVYPEEAELVARDGVKPLLTRFKNAGLPMHSTRTRLNVGKS
jgi:hypothetical protein